MCNIRDTIILIVVFSTIVCFLFVTMVCFYLGSLMVSHWKLRRVEERALIELLAGHRSFARTLQQQVQERSIYCQLGKDGLDAFADDLFDAELTFISRRRTLTSSRTKRWRLSHRRALRSLVVLPCFSVLHLPVTEARDYPPRLSTPRRRESSISTSPK